MYKKNLTASYGVKMSEDRKGVLTVRASSFGNKDAYGDIFNPNAFDRSIESITQDNPLVMLWQHERTAPLGRWYKAWKDDEYLYMEGKLSLGVQRADEAYIHLTNGDIKGISIGFNSQSSFERHDEQGGYEGTTFNDVDLLESSVVTFGANPKAEVSTVKCMSTITEFERFLRDVGGFSRGQAKALTAGGYSAYVEKFGNKSESERSALLRDAEKSLKPKSDFNNEEKARILDAINQFKLEY